ncbi:hypothetical protein Droror1_Dr00001921 [Drosera rotundifolia]
MFVATCYYQVEADDAVTVSVMSRPKPLANEALADLAVSTASKLQCFRIFHFHEFNHASNDEHKRCLPKETVQKMFVMPKIFSKSEAEGTAEEQAWDEYVTHCQAEGTPSAEAVNFVNYCEPVIRYQSKLFSIPCLGPIPPGQNVTYILQVKNQIRSFFYFPSLEFQKAAGGFGGIRIYSRPLIPVPFPTPAGDYTVLIGDWYQANHTTLRKTLDNGHRLPFPDGVLINGRGSGATFNVQQGSS